MSFYDLTDIFLFLLAGVIGGIVGGSIAFALCRRGDRPVEKSRRDFFLVPQPKAKIIRFPTRN